MIERLERPARCLIAIVALAIGLTTAGAVRATTSDLSVEGVYYFQVTGNTVVISIDKVTNITVPPRISGELSLELWAFRVPYQGLGQEGYQQDGYRLASYPMGRLSPGSFLFGVNSGSIAYTPPPPGTWYLTLLVVEYDGSAINFGGLSPRAFFNFGAPQSPIVERIKITGNLLTIYETLVRFVSRYCDLHETRPKNLPESVDNDSPVPARAIYHRGVVTEAIANMLAHRDLALRDLPSRLHVFDHSLEFVNSRRSTGFSPVAQKAIRYGMPERLNPRLAAVLTSAAYGLKLPLQGLPALLREARRFSNRKAEIVSFNDEFRLRIYGVF